MAVSTKPYSENSTITIINPERIPHAQENVAKIYVQIIENRINKMRQEALKTQAPEEPNTG